MEIVRVGIRTQIRNSFEEVRTKLGTVGLILFEIKRVGGVGCDTRKKSHDRGNDPRGRITIDSLHEQVIELGRTKGRKEFEDILFFEGRELTSKHEANKMVDKGRGVFSRDFENLTAAVEMSLGKLKSLGDKNRFIPKNVINLGGDDDTIVIGLKQNALGVGVRNVLAQNKLGGLLEFIYKGISGIEEPKDASMFGMDVDKLYHNEIKVDRQELILMNKDEVKDGCYGVAKWERNPKD